MSSMMERAEAAGLPVHHFDLQTDDRMGVEPFAVWDEVRGVGPLLFYSTGGRGFFVATDYETIKLVQQDYEVWSNSPTTITYTSEEINMEIVPENMDPQMQTAYKNCHHATIQPSSDQDPRATGDRSGQPVDRQDPRGRRV